MKVKLSNLDGSAAKGDIELSDAVFGLEPRADILHRVVTWQLENRRGIARATRERSDVARTGKKFGRQKGGGTARHGDRAAPVFIGGGKAHGARRREFDVSLNKKVRALGLKMALSAKAKDGLIVVDSLELKDAKTKALSAQLAKANWGKKVLVIDGDAVDAGFARAIVFCHPLHFDQNVAPRHGLSLQERWQGRPSSLRARQGPMQRCRPQG